MKTYERKRFQTLICVATLTMFIEYVMQLLISVIAGNVLGEAALAAIAITTPVNTFIIFVTYLVSVGTTINISYQKGSDNDELANQYFGQGFFLILIFGALLTGFMLWLHAWLPSNVGMSLETSTYLEEYLRWAFILPLPLMLSAYLYDVLIIEGGEQICAATAIIQLILTSVLCWFLCKVFGIGGIMLGTLISVVLVLIILSIYMFMKSSFHLQFVVKRKLLWPVFRCSFVDSSAYLYAFLAQLILNALALHMYGDKITAVLAVVLNIQAMFLALFDGIGEAISPLINVYLGEGCQRGVKKTMALAKPAALIEGIVMSIVLLLFAGMIPNVFGIVNPELVLETVKAVRIYALAAPFFSILLLYTSYYLYINKIRFSVGMTTLYLLVCPITFCFLLSKVMGISGIWAGLALSGPAAMIIGGIIIWVRKGDATFPDLLDLKQLENELQYNVPKTNTGFEKLVKLLKKDLKQRKVNPILVNQILQEVKESVALLLSKGEERRSIMECNLLFDDTITVILRDSGHYAGLPVAEEGEEEHSFAVEHLSEGSISVRNVILPPNKKFVMTGGKNRVILKFFPFDDMGYEFE